MSLAAIPTMSTARVAASPMHARVYVRALSDRPSPKIILSHTRDETRQDKTRRGGVSSSSSLVVYPESTTRFGLERRVRMELFCIRVSSRIDCGHWHGMLGCCFCDTVLLWSKGAPPIGMLQCIWHTTASVPTENTKTPIQVQFF